MSKLNPFIGCLEFPPQELPRKKISMFGFTFLLRLYLKISKILCAKLQFFSPAVVIPVKPTQSRALSLAGRRIRYCLELTWDLILVINFLENLSRYHKERAGACPPQIDHQPKFIKRSMLEREKWGCCFWVWILLWVYFSL